MEADSIPRKRDSLLCVYWRTSWTIGAWLLCLIYSGYEHRNRFRHRFEPLEDDAFQLLRQSFIAYIQSEYLQGPAEASAACE